MKVTNNKIAKQEQLLDAAQAILREVLSQAKMFPGYYRRSDLRNLEAAELALDKVTLRKDLGD